MKAACGTFYVNVAAKDLASLRVYGCWYNDKGITTTHEKGALGNHSDLAIFPTVVCDAHHETYLVLPNISDEKIQFQAMLMNHLKGKYPKNLQITLEPRAAAMLPVSKFFPDAVAFLDRRPGALYLSANPRGKAMYYYFIYDKRRGSWQIQHT